MIGSFGISIIVCVRINSINCGESWQIIFDGSSRADEDGRAFEVASGEMTLLAGIVPLVFDASVVAFVGVVDVTVLLDVVIGVAAVVVVDVADCSGFARFLYARLTRSTCGASNA